MILRRLSVADVFFFSLVVILATLGLTMVYSASSVTALDQFGESSYFLKRQGLFMAVGFAVMMLIMNTDYRKWLKWGGVFMLISVGLLLLLHVPGMNVVTAGIATRWLRFGGIGVQPAEVAKLSTLLYVSWALVRKGNIVRSFSYGYLPMMLTGAVMGALLLWQPDFGNAVLLFTLVVFLVFLAGARWTHLLGTFLIAAPTAWILMNSMPYRKRRLLAFMNPWDDPQNVSYQIVQSFTAFCSGSFWGTGLGNGKSKLYYLPEAQTDFIMAVLAEELGFIGLLFVILCFALLVVRGFRIAKRAPDQGGFFLAASCTSLLGMQALLHMGVVTGLLPTKGLPLPFISHGGSALIISFVAAGLVLSVAHAMPREVETHPV